MQNFKDYLYLLSLYSPKSFGAAELAIGLHYLPMVCNR